MIVGINSFSAKTFIYVPKHDTYYAIITRKNAKQLTIVVVDLHAIPILTRVLSAKTA